MNIGDLFDSPWKVLIVAVVVLVLFGSAKLPVAARSLGRSMRILKSEVSKIHDDEEPDPAGAVAQAQAQALPAASSPSQNQIEELQRQVRDLQQQAAGVNATAEAQRTQQPG